MSCERVPDAAASAAAGDVRAGPFGQELVSAARGNGIAKLWVASTRRPSKPRPDARIRVEVMGGDVRADPAVYVRPAAVAATISPTGFLRATDTPETMYPGTIIVPRTTGARLRITVTIGSATGCFLTRL